MAARRRRVLLDFGGSSTEARRVVREVKDDLRRLAREEVEARIDVNERVVLAKIDRVRERIRKLKTQDASVDVDVKLAAAYAQLDRLNVRLERLKARRVAIDVDVSRGATERTVAAIGGVRRELAKLDNAVDHAAGRIPLLGGFFSAPVKLARAALTGISLTIRGIAALPDVLSRVAAGVSGAFSAVQSFFSGGMDISRVFTGLGSALSSLVGLLPMLATGIGTAGLGLGSLAAVGGVVVIALNAILGAIIALGGALVALVASAAAAAAGLGALAVAFGAVLIPVVIVAFAVFSRFAAILKARQAHEQELTSALQAQRTAEQQRKAALDQVKSAQEGVRQAIDQRKQAEQNLAQTIIDGHKAAAQAIIDEKDAQLALEDARLGQRGAKLGLLDAKKALRDLLTQAGVTGHALDHLFKQFSDVHVDPTKLQDLLGAVGGAGGNTQKIDPLALAHAILNVQQAQQGVKDAVNQTAHAERALGDATKKRIDFARRGLNAYAPYVQALAGVKRANDSVTQAERRVQQAQDRVVAAQNRVTAAQSRYEHALKGLSPTEQSALGRLNQLVSGFKAFAKVLADPIFKAIGGVFDSMKGHAGDLESALGQVGQAMADVITAIGRFLTEPATLTAFKTMASGAADLVRQLGARAFTSFLRIMREVATSALPAVRAAARGVADWLGRIAGQPRRIHGAVQTLVEQFRTWARFAGAVARLVIALFSAAAPAGKSLAGSMTRIVDHWTAWIRANPDKVRKFFADAVNKAKAIVGWLAAAVSWLKNHLPKAAQTAADAFRTIGGVVSGIYHGLKTIVDLLRGDFKSAAQDAGKSLASSLLNLSPEKLGESVGKSIVNKFLHKQSGGIVPGSGSGDIVPAMLEPGEFVVRRSIVQQLSLPVLHALNGGAVPQLQPAPAVAGGDTHHHYHPPPAPAGQYPDGRSWIEHINKLVELKG